MRQSMLRSHFDWTTDTSTGEWLTNEYPSKLTEEKREELDNMIELVQNSYPEDKTTPAGEDLFRHLVRTAQIIDEIGIRDDAVLATLGAYLPNYNQTWRVDLEKLGLKRLVPLIDGLKQLSVLTEFAKVDNVKDDREKKEQAEQMRKMILAMADDIRTVIIKLAMRTRTLQYLGRVPDSEIKVNIAKETLDIFAPLANRLGLWMLKWQLEDLGFRYQYPDEYREIADKLDGNRDERARYIDSFATLLQDRLTRAGIKCEVKGRPKHIYSIWRKMQKKKLQFEQLFDIRAVRVLVETVHDCYTTLCIVHELWQPISGEFDDYISHPKANDYRSIHTVVVGPEDKGVEIQIRTFEMHNSAEYGVAAHWKYKEGGKRDAGYEQKIAWLRSLIDWRDHIPVSGENEDGTRAGKSGDEDDGTAKPSNDGFADDGRQPCDPDDPRDIASHFKQELFQETIYVLSPKGKVVSLPYGSTPIDFAYALHTEVGHHCRGALVDGKIVPLFTRLETGQRVEIITAKSGSPSIDWLQDGWVKSPKAIAKVRSHLKSLNVEEKIETGRALLEKRIDISNYKVGHQKIIDKLKFENVQDLCLALGRAEVSVYQLDGAINRIKDEEEKKRLENRTMEEMRLHKSTVKSQRKNGILIDGELGIFTTLAKCCTPAPPDEIVGFITKEKGVSIHCRDCPSFAHLSLRQPNKVVQAEWNIKSNQKELLFSVQLEIMGQDRAGLQAIIFATIARHQLHITHSTSFSRQGVLTMRLTIETYNSGEAIKYLLKEINQVQDVYSARRI